MNLTPQSLVYLQVQEELKITASLLTEKKIKKTFYGKERLILEEAAINFM